MPTSWETTQNGPQRVVALPLIPSAVDAFTITAAATTDRRTWTLSATNLANSAVDLYIHWVSMTAAKTAAASAIDIALQWQFFNGGGVGVGAISAILTASCGWNGAAAAGLASNYIFTPSFPYHLAAAIPATAVTVRLQSVSANIAGAPSISCLVANGFDPTNRGTVGDFGGLGSVAQGANNPNHF